MKLTINPENYDQKYLEYLNECFANWGNIMTFNWVINREFNNTKPDFFIIESDKNEVLAGSAISYRKLKFPDHSFQEIGIMTGSWTLPISRGLGCFTASIKKSLELVVSKKMNFLTAFVTENNASFRRLKQAGSFLIPTSYIVSNSLNVRKLKQNENVKILENSEEISRLFFNKRAVLVRNKIHFDYSFDDFENQFIKRVNPVFLLQIKTEYAIVEQTATIFQMHFSTNYDLETVTEIVNWANNQEKELLFFTTNKTQHFFKKFKIIAGFFSILSNKNNFDYDAIFSDDLVIEFGDKM